MIFHLKNGRAVLFRHIRPADAELIAEGMKHLSDETKRLRFMAPKPRLTSSELRYFTEVDRRNHVALVAVLADQPDRIAGIGRFVRLREDSQTAEFAILVTDELQGQGLGTELAQRLAAEARLRGIRRLSATILQENVAVKRLLEHISAGLAQPSVAHGPTQDLVFELAA